MPSRPPTTPIKDLFDQAITELDKSIRQPNILAYRPYPEQERFHRSDAFGRYVAGGNRGGKTDSTVVEAIWWLTDTHPYRERPEAWGHGAIQGRFVVVDVEKGVNQIIIPKLKRWLARSMLVDGSWDKSWDNKGLILTLSNGSTLDFVTHHQGIDKQGGVPRHFIMYDEEPPQDIFNENAMRLLDFEGFWVIAATPVQGMGWTYDLLWEPAQAGEIPKSELDTFTLSAAQNPYLQASKEVRGRYYIGMSKEEREIREEGKFVARSGLVFPNFSTETHTVEPWMPPKSWAWYMSVDFGYNHPTAILWHAVSPDYDIITFAEQYADHVTVPTHAGLIHAREHSWGKEPELRVGDNAGHQHYGTTGTSYIQEYALKGVYIQTEMVPRDVMIGVEKMQQYMAIQKRNRWGENKSRWVISQNCPNFIREMKKLRWATYDSQRRAYEMGPREEIHKVNDDAFDSARYFATVMPDLRPMEDEFTQEKEPTTLSYVAMMARMREQDDIEWVDEQVSTRWDDQEEYQGVNFG